MIRNTRNNFYKKEGVSVCSYEQTSCRLKFTKETTNYHNDYRALFAHAKREKQIFWGKTWAKTFEARFK